MNLLTKLVARVCAGRQHRVFRTVIARNATVRMLGVGIMLLAIFSAVGKAQDASTPSPLPSDSQPIEVEENAFRGTGARPQFEAKNQMSKEAELAVGLNRVVSIPTFTSAFTYREKIYSIKIVGGAPQQAETTRIGTQIIPISLVFEGIADREGSPILLDPNGIVSKVRNSPNFRNASYETGPTQFGDAVQRAEFWGSMNQDWHTLLEQPRTLTSVTIDVPKGFASVYHVRSTDTTFAVVDEGFFISQLNTILQFESLDIGALPIALTTNVLLAPNHDLHQCCTLGFHTAYGVGRLGNQQFVQTFAWASWLDTGVFGGTLADITPLSHEISEWMNNPFGTNLVPEWQAPNGGGDCDDVFETGDPMEVFPNSGFPVPIDGFTYHPQTEALLQWFQRKTPSDAVHGAFSFPDTTLLTSPSQPCAAH
ncbi:MAG TPA: hypothetical protein VKZ53_22505 [Candidatus Angelobacter sp.]|nr:hypothetical protein [Candidatus Angelobacter sp.]